MFTKSVKGKGPRALRAISIALRFVKIDADNPEIGTMSVQLCRLSTTTPRNARLPTHTWPTGYSKTPAKKTKKNVHYIARHAVILKLGNNINNVPAEQLDGKAAYENTYSPLATRNTISRDTCFLDLRMLTVVLSLSALTLHLCLSHLCGLVPWI